MQGQTAKASASELLLRQRLGALTRTLVGARAGDVNAIHQARVATRRLREAVGLVPSRSKGIASVRRTRCSSTRSVTRSADPSYAGCAQSW